MNNQVETPETKLQSSEYFALMIIEKMRQLGAKKLTLIQTRKIMIEMRNSFYREWKEELVKIAKEREAKQELKLEEVVHGETIVNQ